MTDDDKRWLRSDEAAVYLGYSPATLKDSRREGHKLAGVTPPPHFNIGRTIRYKRSDLDEWVHQ